MLNSFQHLIEGLVSYLSLPTYFFSAEDEDNLLCDAHHLKRPLLPNLLSEPVVEAKVFINQNASHDIYKVQVLCQNSFLPQFTFFYRN